MVFLMVPVTFEDQTTSSLQHKECLQSGMEHPDLVIKGFCLVMSIMIPSIPARFPSASTIPSPVHDTHRYLLSLVVIRYVSLNRTFFWTARVMTSRILNPVLWIDKGAP
jgi:hypothetical protein